VEPRARNAAVRIVSAKKVVSEEGETDRRHVVMQDHPRIEEVPTRQLATEDLLRSREMDEVIVGNGEDEVLIEEGRGEEPEHAAPSSPRAWWS